MSGNTQTAFAQAATTPMANFIERHKDKIVYGHMALWRGLRDTGDSLLEAVREVAATEAAPLTFRLPAELGPYFAGSRPGERGFYDTARTKNGFIGPHILSRFEGLRMVFDPEHQHCLRMLKGDIEPAMERRIPGVPFNPKDPAWRALQDVVLARIVLNDIGGENPIYRDPAEFLRRRVTLAMNAFGEAAVGQAMAYKPMTHKLATWGNNNNDWGLFRYLPPSRYPAVYAAQTSELS